MCVQKCKTIDKKNAKTNECGKNVQNNDCKNLISLCFYAQRFFGVYLGFSTYLCMYVFLCMRPEKTVLRIRHAAHFEIHVFC